MIGIYHKYYCVNIEKLNLVCFVVNIACIVIIVVFLVRKLKIKKKNYSRRKKVSIVSFLRKSQTFFGGETWVKKSTYEEILCLAKKYAHLLPYLNV
jgi:hypothetical protein